MQGGGVYHPTHYHTGFNILAVVVGDDPVPSDSVENPQGERMGSQPQSILCPVFIMD